MHASWQKLIWVFSSLALVVFFGHFWFWVSPDIFVKNDLEVNVLQIRFIKMSGWATNWNPYINLPVWEDPLLGYLNPFWAIPVIFLPVQLGVKISFAINLGLSGIGMYFLLRSQRIAKAISLVAAMTVVLAGFPTARIIAGHSEKILSWMFMPWILFLLINKKNNLITGLFIAMTVWSGDIYAFVYSLILAGVYGRFKAILFALSIAMVRLVSILSISDKLYKPVEPLLGRQNLFSIGYHLFLPVKAIWGKMMVWVPSDFGWWEKTAYIGPLPLMVLFNKTIRNFRGVIKINRTFWAILSLIILSMVGWRGEWFKYFHVPTRVFGYLGLLVILVTASIIRNVKLWLLNLMLCFSMTWYAYLKRPMPIINRSTEKLMSVVSSGKLVAFDQLNFPIKQLTAQERGVRLVATSYGFMLADSDARKWLDFRLGKECYSGNLPDYIIYPYEEDMGCLTDLYVLKLMEGSFALYEKNDF